MLAALNNHKGLEKQPYLKAQEHSCRIRYRDTQLPGVVGTCVGACVGAEKKKKKIVALDTHERCHLFNTATRKFSSSDSLPLS